MSDKLVNELEEILIPYALERFSLTNNPAAQMIQSSRLFRTMLGSQMDRAENLIEQFATWLCRAFIRTLVNVENAIYLSDVATVIYAEASLMMELPPYGFQSGTDDDGERADSKIMIEIEAHHWFVYLQEKGKLPGNYNRFIGKYKS